MQDDGLDGAVITILPQLLDYILGRNDYAFQVDHADLVAEAAEGILLLRAHAEINQRKDGDQEEEEGSSSEQHPKKQAGARLVGHIGKVSVAEKKLSARKCRPYSDGCDLKPDVACYPQYSATRGAATVGDATN